MPSVLPRLLPPLAVLAAALAVAIGVTASSGDVAALRTCAPLLRLADQLAETRIGAGLTSVQVIQAGEDGTIRRRTITAPVTSAKLIAADLCDLA